MRTIRRVLFALFVVLLLLFSAFSVWAYTPLGPASNREMESQPGDGIAVETQPWLAFRPAGAMPATGLILYPGGRVDYRSYAPAARAIAERGYLVVIVPMPFNLAVTGINRADGVIAAYPEIRNWTIGGHSLGGAMAAAYAYGQPESVRGLVLWAAYPADNNSLADRDLAVVSVYGTADGLATGDKIDASRALLPRDTVWLPIEGGNHAQFGDYGPQGGDGAATISREEQQSQVVNATADLLKSLGN